MALPKLQFNLFLSNPNSASSLPENPFTVQCRQAAVLPPFTEKWSVDSWRTKKTLQLPKYQKQTKDIEEFPPLITPVEARSLHDKLGDAAFGKAFLLQGGGDCAAESSKEFNGDRIRETFNILLQMATVLILGETCTCDAQVSDRMDPNELVKLIDILNPANLPGRITIISRMGSERLESQASGIDQCCAWVKANRDMGLRAHAWKRQSAMWSCGLKSARPFDHVLSDSNIGGVEDVATNTAINPPRHCGDG
ncbi:unnamed protein product [Linum tenue]|uniref:Phospho-2-dehydro-3-deoxyheptonate aldolase n=1 Tax=Linum tenue TaxID=586396 RepID=A0AAV0N6C0_9ROSI|nr:unnamed protein product [Linum tenue]